MTSKEKFEKWINENILDPNLLIARNTEHAGKYQSAFMEQRWEVWQATQADQAETIVQLQLDNARLLHVLRLIKDNFAPDCLELDEVLGETK